MHIWLLFRHLLLLSYGTNDIHSLFTYGTNELHSLLTYGTNELHSLLTYGTNELYSALLNIMDANLVKFKEKPETFD